MNALARELVDRVHGQVARFDRVVEEVVYDRALAAKRLGAGRGAVELQAQGIQEPMDRLGFREVNDGQRGFGDPRGRVGDLRWSRRLAPRGRRHEQPQRPAQGRCIGSILGRRLHKGRESRRQGVGHAVTRLRRRSRPLHVHVGEREREYGRGVPGVQHGVGEPTLHFERFAVFRRPDQPSTKPVSQALRAGGLRLPLGRDESTQHIGSLVLAALVPWDGPDPDAVRLVAHAARSTRSSSHSTNAARVTRSSPLGSL